MRNESKTLFIPLSGKARMSREGFFEDPIAEQIVQTECCTEMQIDTSKRLAIYMAMRAMQYDAMTAQFLQTNPDAIVIHLACGLDSRCHRVKNKPKCWYDLDFSDVIQIRKQYYVETESYQMIASSVTEHNWLSQIVYDGEPVLILAEGLSMYLTKVELQSLMYAFQKRFDKTLFILDAYSDFAARISQYKNPINAVQAKVSFSMDTGSILEDAEHGIVCCMEQDIILKAYIEKLHGLYRYRFAFMRKFGSKLYRIYGYTM